MRTEENLKTPGGVIGRSIQDCVNEKAVDAYASGVAKALTEDDILNDIFRYHAPTPDQLPKYAAVREAGKHFAKILLMNVPHGPDRSTAIRKIREAVMTANQGIAFQGRITQL